MKRIILEYQQVDLILTRICHELVEKHGDFKNAALIALQPRGVFLGKVIQTKLNTLFNITTPCGELDTTFHRDDFRRRETPLIPSATNIDFDIENKNVVLMDDVLYTGRTIRAGLDALLAFGRPKKVELLTMIDRRFRRDLPISADYVGKTVDTLISERVSVEWTEIEGEDKVVLFTPDANG